MGNLYRVVGSYIGKLSNFERSKYWKIHSWLTYPTSCIEAEREKIYDRSKVLRGTAKVAPNNEFDLQINIYPGLPMVRPPDDVGSDLVPASGRNH